MRPNLFNDQDHVLSQCVGIDVSKKSLMATMCMFSLAEEAHYSKAIEFSNTKAGFNQLVKWSRKETCKGVPLRYVMEATGVYHEDLANHLAKIGCVVIVLMPNKAREFAYWEGMITKNDIVDSRVLALVGCVKRRIRQWQPQTPIYHELRTMTRFSQDAKKLRTELKNHLEALIHGHDTEKSVIKHYESMMAALNKRIEMNQKNMEKKVASDKALSKKVANIITAPSLGFLSVVTVIAETNGFALVQNRKQLASYAGFDVIDKQSGPVEHKSRISKKGNSRIRSILYMPAVQCPLHNRHLKKVYDRIVGKHPDSKMIAVTAVERRLLLLIYTLWKSDKPYSDDFNKE
jgi:transposase